MEKKDASIKPGINPAIKSLPTDIPACAARTIARVLGGMTTASALPAIIGPILIYFEYFR